MTACRSCGAPILWVKSERGRVMPIDAEPYTGDKPGGLFALRPSDTYRIAIAASPEAFPGEPLYRSHFATCPDAAEHRR